MDGFMKATAAVLICAILCLILAKQGKDFSVLLSILGCVMVLTIGLGYLQKLIDYLQRLESLIQPEGNYLPIVLKIVGIGLTGEIAALICKDSGNEALGRSLQILGTIMILCLSIPLFESLLDLITAVLGGI